MALKLGELVAYIRGDRSQLTRDLAGARGDVRAAGRDMERDAEATARRMAESMGRGGRDGGDGFVRGADGRLRDARGRFAAAGQQAGAAAAGGFSSLTGALSDLGGAIGEVGGSLSGLIPIITNLVAGAVFAIPVIYALGGALGSLPALAVGGGAAIGTLMLGFHGLSDAFNETARAGGGVSDRAYQVARAERQVRDANREVTASQEALNEARKTAVERLQDLDRNLRGARLNERAAAVALADARKDLDRAQRSGKADDIERAQLAYEQAQLAVEDAADGVEDLADEHEEATRKGVEGSDEVTAAVRRQERAVEAVEDAEHALAQARKGSGGGGAAGEVTKLAASANELVSVLKGLAPEWENLRLGVQQRLFAGVGREVQLLADAWLPRLETSLGRYADTFNGIFKRFSTTARDPKVMDDLGTGMEGVRVQIDKIGLALAGPGLRAFSKLAAAAKPFLDVLGDKFAGAVESFAKWIDEAEESGELKTFFETAAKYLGQIWDLGGDVVSVIGEFFSIWSDTDNADAGLSLFDKIRAGMADLKEWLSDPENQEKIRQIVDGFMAIGTAVMDVIGWLVETGIPAAWSFFEMLSDGWDWAMSAAGKAKDWIVTKLTDLVTWVKGLPGRITSAASGMWNGIKDSFRMALNWIIDRWNNLSFTLPSATFFGQTVGGGKLSMPYVPRLDVGGRILQDGLAVVHREEVVVPAAQVRRLDRGEPALGGAAGGAQQVRLTGEFKVRGQDLVLVLRDIIAGRPVDAVIGG